MSQKKTATLKLFVLDTNIIMHDPTCMFRFKEHDVYIPACVLEELDDHKKGPTDLARNVRQAMRFFTELVESAGPLIAHGIPLARGENRSATGRLYFQTEEETLGLPEGITSQKVDNQILAIVASLKEKRADRTVILVSKDINIRIKASTRGIVSEDYTNDNVLEDSDLIYSGVRKLTQGESERIHGARTYHKGRHTYYELSGKIVRDLTVNQALIHTDEQGETVILLVDSLSHASALLRSLKDNTGTKQDAWGVGAKNVEQDIALHFLMNPEIDIVTLLGQAGTGKTLLTLAAGLEQVIEKDRYHQIIMTRATVPIGEDIGFLPGTEEEKMHPWMGALEDNLQFLSSLSDTPIQGKQRPKEGHWEKNATMDLLRTRISVKSLNFMRGRTFIKKFLIVDEAQNLTAKQMRTLITRAGPGTKVVCLGNVAQIDTPYLTEGNSGITYTVARFKGWKHYGHVTLAQGERSRLAGYAGEVM